MSGEPEYRITFVFSSYESLLKHLHLLAFALPLAETETTAEQTAEDNAQPPSRTATPTETAPRPPRRENERRGAHTAAYHAAAKQYRLEHPELSYRECYKTVSAARASNL